MNETLKAAGHISAELGAAMAEIARLRGLLAEATQEIEDWGTYASEYFQERHDLPGTVARFRAALSQQAEPAPINQCDGCQAGILVDKKGYHRMGKPGGYADLMGCQSKRYVSEPAPAQDERVAEVPPMPETADRRSYIDSEPDGYLEGNRDWAEVNDDAVEWLADNHRAIRAALTRPAQAEQQPSPSELIAALQQIERWDGFPGTGKTWPESGEPMSYGACFGSNGERNFMRLLAAKAVTRYHTALSATPSPAMDAKEE
jgi:hypothetical protein